MQKSQIPEHIPLLVLALEHSCTLALELAGTENIKNEF